MSIERQAASSKLPAKLDPYHTPHQSPQDKATQHTTAWVSDAPLSCLLVGSTPKGKLSGILQICHQVCVRKKPLAPIPELPWIMHHDESQLILGTKSSNQKSSPPPRPAPRFSPGSEAQHLRPLPNVQPFPSQCWGTFQVEFLHLGDSVPSTKTIDGSRHVKTYTNCWGRWTSGELPATSSYCILIFAGYQVLIHTTPITRQKRMVNW